MPRLEVIISNERINQKKEVILQYFPLRDLFKSDYYLILACELPTTLSDDDRALLRSWTEKIDHEQLILNYRCKSKAR